MITLLLKRGNTKRNSYNCIFIEFVYIHTRITWQRMVVALLKISGISPLFCFFYYFVNIISLNNISLSQSHLFLVARSLFILVNIDTTSDYMIMGPPLLSCIVSFFSFVMQWLSYVYISSLLYFCFSISIVYLLNLIHTVGGAPFYICVHIFVQTMQNFKLCTFPIKPFLVYILTLIFYEGI